ncbi:MAG: prolipoprotein diacylglyceryl transferase [Eubacteriales bacterium]
MSVGRRIAVHPTFLYESLWNALGFVLLHFASKRRKYDGQTFLTYLAWYGLGRGLIEGLRTDSLYFLNTGLRVSQLLAFASCLVALLILGYNALFRQHDPNDMQLPVIRLQRRKIHQRTPSLQNLWQSQMLIRPSWRETRISYKMVS